MCAIFYENLRLILLTFTFCDDRIDLYIDDKLGGTTRLPVGANMHIGSMRGTSGGLFLGGVPVEGDYMGVAASLTPLRGCLQDLVINGQ